MSDGTIATAVLDPDTASLDAAIETAGFLSYHLDVLCMAPAMFLPPPVMADGIVQSVVAADFAREVQENEAWVKQRLAREDLAWTVSGLVSAHDALHRSIRFADLALLPRSDTQSADIARLFESLLYNAPVPILLTDRGLSSLDRVLVAWDESDVSLAAVRAAAPFLARAGTVEIVTVDLPDAGEDLAQMLSRRRISPVLTRLGRGESTIAETLIAQAKATGADLIVAGAYGHSRLREMIIGGVTRDLLRLADVPLLLAR